MQSHKCLGRAEVGCLLPLQVRNVILRALQAAHFEGAAASRTPEAAAAAAQGAVECVFEQCLQARPPAAAVRISFLPGLYPTTQNYLQQPWRLER
jgi:hypothetical protein